MLILSAEFIPDKVSLQVGQVSDRDVVSPRTISYVDTAKTKHLEAEVLASVPNVYDLDVSVMTKAEESIAGIFRSARNVITDKNLNTVDLRVEKLESSLPVTLPAAAIQGLANLDETTLSRTEEFTRNVLRKYLQRGIRDDDLDNALKQVVMETEKNELGDHAEAVVAAISQS
ncbi:MAG TPA: phosphohydrolase, partial [Sporomusaceae bacterium]|nr:phosphohydrolase [Sporomusaceae bacterium]